MAKEKTKKISNMKRMLILGFMFFAIGAFLWLLGMTFIGWNFGKLDSLTYTKHSINLESEVLDGQNPTEFDFSVEDFALRVKNGTEFSLEYYTTEDSSVNYWLEDSTFKFVSEETYNISRTNFFSYIANNSYRGMNRGAYKYVLTVPNNMPLVLNHKNGNVFVEGDFESVDITINNGRINLSGNSPLVKINQKNGGADLEIKADSLDYQGDNGYVYLHDSVVKDVSMKLDNENLTAVEIAVENDFALNVKNGNAYLRDFELGSLTANANNGKVSLDDGKIAGLFKLNGKNGRLDLFDMKSVGSVELSLDDYRVRGNKFTSEEMTATVEDCNFNIFLDIKRISLTGDNNTLRIEADKDVVGYVKSSGKNSGLKVHVNGDRVDENDEWGVSSSETFIVVSGKNNTVRVVLD